MSNEADPLIDGLGDILNVSPTEQVLFDGVSAIGESVGNSVGAVRSMAGAPHRIWHEGHKDIRATSESVSITFDKATNAFKAADHAFGTADQAMRSANVTAMETQQVLLGATHLVHKTDQAVSNTFGSLQAGMQETRVTLEELRGLVRGVQQLADTCTQCARVSGASLVAGFGGLTMFTMASALGNDGLDPVRLGIGAAGAGAGAVTAAMLLYKGRRGNGTPIQNHEI
jgi:hypothetical protein